MISDWVPGNSFCLLDYGIISKPFRSQLLALGLTKGVVVRVIRIAPLGDPIQIALRGVMLALRSEDLLAMQWKKL